MPTDTRDSWGERLPRTVGLLPAVMVLVGVTIGSGIFRVPADVAGGLGTSGPVLLAWVLGGVLALFGALTLAELAAMYPRSGGGGVFVTGGSWCRVGWFFCVTLSAHGGGGCVRREW